MKLVKKIAIREPITKEIQHRKRPKIDKRTGKLITKVVTYLTANIFYTSTHFFTRDRIVNYTKDWLMPFLTDIPKLKKMRLKVTYMRPNENWDLDNKVYFWVKILMDILKTPSSRKLANAKKKGKVIKTLNVIPEDTVKYVDEIIMKFEKGEHHLVIEIYGIEDTTPVYDQLEMFEKSQ